MNSILVPEDVVNTIKSFVAWNEGDGDTISLLLSVGAELLDISSDTMYEMISNNN